MSEISVPLAAGFILSGPSTQVIYAGEPLPGITGVTVKILTPGRSHVYGLGRLPLGISIGQIGFEGEFTFERTHAEAWRTSLGSGYLDMVHDFSVIQKQGPIQAEYYLQVVFLSIEDAAKKGDEMLESTMPFLCTTVPLEKQGRNPFAGLPT